MLKKKKNFFNYNSCNFSGDECNLLSFLHTSAERLEEGKAVCECGADSSPCDLMAFLEHKDHDFSLTLKKLQ